MSLPPPPPPIALTHSLKSTRSSLFLTCEEFFWLNSGHLTAGDSYAGIDRAAGLYVEPGRYYENAATKRRIKNLIEVCGLMKCLVTSVEGKKCTMEELLLNHTARYIDSIRAMSAGLGGDAGDCAFFGTGSYDIAALAVGSCIEACKAVMAKTENGRPKTVENAYVLCRPPGHHACEDEGMGFCIFNNVAIAAKYARLHLGAERIAIVDYDVHHGNGTQQAFYGRRDVLFISLHEESLYPIGSGNVDERGEGEGFGFNINCPLPPGTGVGGYSEAMDRVVYPALTAFAPDLILVSSGFDGSALDPLGHQMLTAKFYGDVAARLVGFNTPLVFVHEGGYNENYVPLCGVRVVEALAGVERSNVVDVMQDEIMAYGCQSCQKHQREAIERVEREAVAECIERCKKKRDNMGNDNMIT